MGHTEADDLRDLIAHLEGRIDLEIDDPALRKELWQHCDTAIMWTWQSVDKAREHLVPVHNALDPIWQSDTADGRGELSRGIPTRDEGAGMSNAGRGGGKGTNQHAIKGASTATPAATGTNPASSPAVATVEADPFAQDVPPRYRDQAQFDQAMTEMAVGAWASGDQQGMFDRLAKHSQANPDYDSFEALSRVYDATTATEATRRPRWAGGEPDDARPFYTAVQATDRASGRAYVPQRSLDADEAVEQRQQLERAAVDVAGSDLSYGHRDAELSALLDAHVSAQSVEQRASGVINVPEMQEQRSSLVERVQELHDPRN